MLEAKYPVFLTKKEIRKARVLLIGTCPTNIEGVVDTKGMGWKKWRRIMDALAEAERMGMANKCEAPDICEFNAPCPPCSKRIAERLKDPEFMAKVRKLAWFIGRETDE